MQWMQVGSRGGEEGRDTLACAIELAHAQTHASYREVHSPREVAM